MGKTLKQIDKWMKHTASKRLVSRQNSKEYLLRLDMRCTEPRTLVVSAVFCRRTGIAILLGLLARIGRSQGRLQGGPNSQEN